MSEYQVTKTRTLNITYDMMDHFVCLTFIAYTTS
eukprot:CAMPEP_0170545964 /NCGR_PEP_ID=MMETSP0211-20121228/4341_1 /TAXON_ID=311385 /ORGANISM="Pseudokeronopsis sp., Strain OXSARD2" /LENGTH=33 /DNA_ID= /DNA_START= /DNA_END= /DNA_ORIENTATION=